MNLTTEQIRIIDAKPNGHNLIKGVAGSGKTTVAVQKIPNLINHYTKNTRDKVLLVTYNRTLIQYISYISKKMDLEEEIFFNKDKKDRTIIKTIDQIICSLYYRIKIEKRREIIKQSKMRELFAHAIRLVNKRYTESTIVMQENMDFLIEEIDWIKSCHYTNKEVYLNVDRTGRMSGKEENAKFLLHKNSIHRNAIYDLYVLYEELSEKEGYIDFKTMALVVWSAIQNGTAAIIKYPHIIIDESQDLTKVQLEIISHMYQEEKENVSITFIADTAQSIYSHSWLANHSFKSIGFDMSGRAKILSKNHRTTMEIAKAAYSIIENDEEITKNENYVKPEAVEKHGDMPLYRHFLDEVAELTYIEQLIKTKLCKVYELNEIAIVARTRSQLEHVKQYLINKAVAVQFADKREQKFESNEIQLLTLHSIKGLEFPVIIIMGINEGVLPYETAGRKEENQYETIERKLLYVGMTRAKNELYLTSAKKPSKFIREINPQFLRIGEQAFSPVYHIGIENYQFKEKINHMNSYEEMVRQWYIKELRNKLCYPIELLDIEYKVQAFSKLGFVDIVIFELVNGKKQPVTFIEIKKRNEDLEHAIIQLQQYLSCYAGVLYGVVTNGDQMICVKKDSNTYQKIKQLPKYIAQSTNLYEEYEYLDFRNGTAYNYQRNMEDQEEIRIKKKESQCFMENQECISVDIYGKVAAGPMKDVLEEKLDSVQIPDIFLADKKRCFGLEVNGDSMIEAGIEKGDYVIVQKQNTARRREIVIAIHTQNNEATMKRFDVAGNMVILSPENPKYDTIIIPTNEVLINGVVIGVLKRGKTNRG